MESNESRLRVTLFSHSKLRETYPEHQRGDMTIRFKSRRYILSQTILADFSGFFEKYEKKEINLSEELVNCEEIEFDNVMRLFFGFCEVEFDLY